MTLRVPEELDVPVSGGVLRVCRWGSPGAPAVVAFHGITANAYSFLHLAEHLDGVDLIAPDLRGRARSSGLPGPYGLGSHVDDFVATLDHLGVERAVVAGHSMGGFVAALAAVRHPDRVRSVLLIDGGVAFSRWHEENAPPATTSSDRPGAIPAGRAGIAAPIDGEIDELLERVIGPAMTRLKMRFASREEYLDFWRAHPALAAAWTTEIEAYALRDLDGDRSSCNVEAIREDAKDTLVHEETTTAYRTVTSPISLLRAERGMLDEPTGLYGHFPVRGVADELVPGVNHYTIVASAAGAAVVAGRIRDLLSMGA